jgi:hypothetical protein
LFDEQPRPSRRAPRRNKANKRIIGKPSQQEAESDRPRDFLARSLE